MLHLATSNRIVKRLLLALLALVVAPLGQVGVQARARPFSELIVFGDSLSDTGNAFIASEGLVLFPPYFEGRASNGPVWVEELARKLRLSGPEPSEAGGSNYAWSGAASGPGFSSGLIPNLGVQVQMFLDDRAAAGEWLDGDELIVVRGGANDLFQWFQGGGTGPTAAAGNIADHVAALAAAGGEVFLVSNLGGAGKTPPVRGTLAEPVVTAWESEFNQALKTELSALEQALAAQGNPVTIVRFDTAALVARILAVPRKLGFRNVRDPACPDCGTGTPSPGAEDTVVRKPKRYLFWDLVHPTTKAHQVFGREAARRVKRAVRRRR